MNLCWHLVARQTLGKITTHGLAVGAVARVAAHHHKHHFAQYTVRYGKGCRFNHAGHFTRAGLNLGCGDFLAATVDQILGAVSDVKKTFLVKMTDIAGVEPTVIECLGKFQ